MDTAELAHAGGGTPLGSKVGPGDVIRFSVNTRTGLWKLGLSRDKAFGVAYWEEKDFTKGDLYIAAALIDF